jgi:hypothetical protein
MGKRGLRVRGTKDHVVMAQESEHFGAIGVQLVPVAVQAREIGTVGLQLVKPSGEQRVRVVGARAGAE